MRPPAVGEAATQLPWLSPSAASLLALIRGPAALAWETVRHDPGAVLLILRQAGRSVPVPSVSYFPAILRDPIILEGAIRHLNSPAFVDWKQLAILPIYEACRSCAWLARRLSELSQRADPDNAWVVGLLAPLGWLAVAAVEPCQAAACLGDANQKCQSIKIQRQQWGLDHAGIARRLMRHWGLPSWVADIVGHLELPVTAAQALGADPDLFNVAQTAIALAPTGLGIGINTEINAAVLGLTKHEWDLALSEFRAFRFPDQAWEPPASIPYLSDLLTLAIENLRFKDAPRLEHLERECDELHRALGEQQAGEAERLRGLKLQALAEFAAGAAHEINNPLAVISGQAQYLLGHEPEPARQRALQTVINQAQRIHQVLLEVMQFARPQRPERQVVDMRDLVRETALALGELARERDVQLLCPEPEQPVLVSADARQIRLALECLLRNAIEAAPAGGWARLRLLTPGADRLELVVEDSGSGPAPNQRDHLFDPFYSGRQAGRGRGLGLPTAWRLAREHGGDVRYDGLVGSPTRFVLSLPANGHAVPAGNKEENGHAHRNGASKHELAVPVKAIPDC